MNCPNCQTEVTRERTRVITVRLPESLHGRLRDMAHELHESMNSVCVAALHREAAAHQERGGVPCS